MGGIRTHTLCSRVYVVRWDPLSTQVWRQRLEAAREQLSDLRAQLGSSQETAAHLQGELETARAEAFETAKLADGLHASLHESRERIRLHLLHVQRLLSTKAQLLQERRVLRTTAPPSQWMRQ